uniref:Uncharacterized protein n=1 Tax=Rhizophagus irregularis (strain DAOM 181602 / DAOM 197198 / MUCL 43194) TaxID=747089 RepID=U9SM68_RHIID
MPAKFVAFCYVNDSTERLTQEYTVKEITDVTRTDDDYPTKFIYLKMGVTITCDCISQSAIYYVHNNNNDNNDDDDDDDDDDDNYNNDNNNNNNIISFIETMHTSDTLQ